MADVDNFLKHYGVKGMRWGVRRAGNFEDGMGIANYHPDRTMNRLYLKAQHLAVTDPDNMDAVMDLMDEIMDRRIDIGEMDEDFEF